MTEFEDTVQMAKKILDTPWADPDRDLAMLSRQLLRQIEKSDQLAKDVNKLIESCYYRTHAGKVCWKQGKWFGVSIADHTDEKAFEEAIRNIRHNAGLDENRDTCTR